MKKIIPYLLSIILLVILITIIILNKKEVSNLNSEVDSYKKKVEDLTNKDKEDNKNTTEDIVYKECTYTRTYEFKDYYNYNTTDKNNYYVVLDTYLSKTGPIIEKVTTDIFPKNFNHTKKVQNST